MNVDFENIFEVFAEDGSVDMLLDALCRSI